MMALNGTVHVIDDDQAMRDSVEFLLSSAGYDVKLYESAQAFLDIAEPVFGCIVSDVRMPGMDGMDLLKRLKAGRVALPVVIMTGHGDVPLAVEAMKLGATDFFEKPYDDDALLAAVRTARSTATPLDVFDASSASLHCRHAQHRADQS